MNKSWYTDAWEATGWVTNKALDEVEVPITIWYYTDNDDTGLFPILKSTGDYIDDDGYTQDYELSRREMDCAYEHILEAMQYDPRDEPDYYMEDA